MKKTQEEKLQLLEETVLYYSENTLRRCIAKNQNGYSQCFYYGKKNEKVQSDGCAIGRLLPKKVAKTFDNLSEHCDTAISSLFVLIPKKIKNYGKQYLIVLQDLHDDSCNWTEHGLSKQGEETVEQIKRLISNNQI